ncbi:hypothetical protein BG004_003547, partial [Podila humilis]
YTVVNKATDFSPRNEAVRVIASDITELRTLIEHFSSYPFGRFEYLHAKATVKYQLQALFESFRNSPIQHNEEWEHTIEGVHRNVHSVIRKRFQLQLPDACSHRLEFCQPRLFLVLPVLYLQSQRPTVIAEDFRFYHLCEAGGVHADPQQIHVANHLGYDLNHPEEFMQRFGTFALIALELVRSGFMDGKTNVLECGVDPTEAKHQLSEDSIEVLVEHAIDFIQRLQSVRDRLCWWPNSLETRQIQEYLVSNSSHDLKGGGLYRSTNVRLETSWFCYQHTPKDRILDPHNPLNGTSVDEVLRHGLVFTLNQPTYSVLSSGHQGSIRDVTFDFRRQASKHDMNVLIKETSWNGVKLVRIVNVDHKLYPRTDVDPEQDIIHRHVMASGLNMLIIPGCPRVSEQYVYLNQPGGTPFGIVLADGPERLEFDWFTLRNALDDFRQAMEYRARVSPSDALSTLSATLSLIQADIKGIDFFHKNVWNARLGVINCVIQGLWVSVFPNKVFDLWHWPPDMMGCLLVQAGNPETIEVLHEFIVKSGMQEIRLTMQENMDFCKIVTDLYQQWNRPNPLRLTLLEKGKESESRHLATFEMWVQHMVQKAVVCRHWTSDYISGNTWNATLLEAAVRQFPSTLTHLTVDITQMSERGLLRIQSVIGRTLLEHLRINCVSIPPDLETNVLRALQVVRWPTLKSLVLSGVFVNAWAHLWSRADKIFVSASTSGLLSLTIAAPLESQVELSHTSTLFLHRLICFSSLLELRFANVQMADESDWGLILEAIDTDTMGSVITEGIPDSREQNRREETRIVQQRPLLSLPTKQNELKRERSSMKTAFRKFLRDLK